MSEAISAKYQMSERCHSQNRCARIDCASCSRRYATRLSRRILTLNPRRLFAVELQTLLYSPAEFWQWRTAIRNMVDYHRRETSRWWRDIGLWLWFSADGGVRGIASLEALTEAEFLKAVDQRWRTRLLPIDPLELRSEIIAVIHPKAIYSGAGRARYQSIRTAIWPRRIPSPLKQKSVPGIRRPLEPMPVIII